MNIVIATSFYAPTPTQKRSSFGEESRALGLRGEWSAMKLEAANQSAKVQSWIMDIIRIDIAENVSKETRRL